MSEKFEASSNNDAISGTKLNFTSRPLDVSEFESILNQIEANPDSLEVLKIENSPIRELEFVDLMKNLSIYQKSITRVQIVRFNLFKIGHSYLEHLRSFILSLNELVELNLSDNSFNSQHYGLIINTLKNCKGQVVVNLSGCPFNILDQETLFKTLPKIKKVKEIILDNTNFSKNHIASLNSHVKQAPRQTNLFVSAIRSDLGKSAIDSKKKSKYAIDFSTVAKDKGLPKILIRCECSRLFPPSEMFICTTCSKSLCNFCSKSCIAIAKCFNCSRSISHNNDIKQKIMKECKCCIECPVCKNSLTFVESNSKFFACKFCLWSSITFQGSDERGEELATGMIKNTFMLAKEHENYLTELLYNYKDLMNERVKNTIKDMSEIFKSTIPNSQIKLPKKEPPNKRESSYVVRTEENIKRANLLKDTLSNVVDPRSMNPIFCDFYSKGSQKTDRAQIINAFKVNAFNLNLFYRLPMKVYRNRDDYYIISKLMKSYVAKSCRQCSKTLVNYEIVNNSTNNTTPINPITTSFLYEMNPNYTFKEVKLLFMEPRTYRMTLVVSNFTGYQYEVEFRCKSNCKFSGVSEVINHTFEFNKNVFSITGLKADKNSFVNETALVMELDFVADASEKNVVFELTQKKKMNLKSALTITDDIIIDFGPPQKFYEIFE